MMPRWITRFSGSTREAEDLYAPRREASKGIRAMPSLAPPGQQGILTAPWKTSDARFDRPRVTSGRRWQERAPRSGVRRVAWRRVADSSALPAAARPGAAWDA